jgi:hypothetical protein
MMKKVKDDFQYIGVMPAVKVHYFGIIFKLSLSLY